MHNYLDTDPISGQVTLHEVTEHHHNTYRIGWIVGQRRLSGMHRVFIAEQEYESYFIDPHASDNRLRSDTIEGLTKKILDKWAESQD